MDVNLKQKDFVNPYFVPALNVRLTTIPKTNYTLMRVWKEYFFKYTED